MATNSALSTAAGTHRIPVLRRRVGLAVVVALLLPLALPTKAWAAATDVLLVKDINVGSSGSFTGFCAGRLANVNGTLFFSADDSVHGCELWKSDGRGSGTTLVKDINPGSAGSYPGLTNVNGTLFFAADDGLNGRELWKSDGTEAGTTLVKDINPGSASSYPQWRTNVNGTLFFEADDGINGYELWKSDGTETGTTLVKDIKPGSAFSYLNWLTNVNGKLFFAADNGITGGELWKSDGTNAGTTLVKDIKPGSSGSNVSGLINVNGTVFFSADDGGGGELWKSDGTEFGTTLVKDINLTSLTASSLPTGLTNVNGTLFFAADDGLNGRELWKSDGTLPGTSLVKNIAPFFRSSAPHWLTAAGGWLFFNANDGNGGELWKSDGTESGTTQVKDITPSPAPGPYEITDVGGTVFFGALEGEHGIELWKSDGTEAGTIMVKDINTSSDGIGSDGTPRGLTNVDGTLFFSATDGVNGRELWKAGVFPFHTLAVSKDGGGSGTVTSSPAGIDCGPDCSEAYEVGTQVTLTPTAASGSSFAGWGGACTGTADCTVTIDEARSVSATFVRTREVSVGDVVVAEGDAGTRAAVFTVSLSEPSEATVTVAYATADSGASAGSDYTAKSGTLSFAPGTTTMPLKVLVAGDKTDEGDEAFTLTLSQASAATIGDGTGVGTIVDDDPGTGRRLAIGDVSVHEGDAGSRTAVFTVSLSKPSTSTVSVSYATPSGTAIKSIDYTPKTATLRFAPGVTSMVVKVAVNPDGDVEGDEVFTVKLSGASGATITDAVGVGTIVDDE